MANELIDGSLRYNPLFPIDELLEVAVPIYEYRCNSCGAEKEHLQKMSDDPIALCPACGSDDYIKLISAAGFQLKGSGWYVTDFKDSNKKSKPAKMSESTTTTPTAKDAQKTSATTKPSPSPSSTTD